MMTAQSCFPNIISQKLTAHYSAIEDYMADNKLVINADKTHVIVMAPRRLASRREEVAVKAGPFTIKSSESEKLLGINIHQSMTWNHHIRDGDGSVLKQLTTRINGLKKLSSKADFKTKLTLANGIVMSKLCYGLAMWGNCQGYLRKALQVQQLTAARAVCGYSSFFWSTGKLLSTCGWLSVNQLYWQQVLTSTHKIMTNKKPINLHNRMISRHRHGTRTATGVSRGFEGLLVKNSFNYSAATYNNLPQNLRTAKSMHIFKKQLRQWVVSNIPV